MLEFDWVDAFTDRAFGGNGCAVVHHGAHLPVETCTAYVRETSLVECTFTGPSDIADVKVRYFLASREIPFAGHPTLATVAAMRHRGMIGDGALTLETGAGIVPVTVEGSRVTMTQIAPQFGATVPKDVLARVGSISAEDIIAPPQIVSTGLPFCITLVRSRAVLDSLRIDPTAYQLYAEAYADGATDLMEPYWATLDAPEGADSFARLLLLPPSPPEDPFTGSATGAMASYLWAHGLIDNPQFVAGQGDGMGRMGRAQVQVQGPQDAITGVAVAGDGFVLMSGTVHL